jgi:hypothetical protein
MIREHIRFVPFTLVAFALLLACNERRVNANTDRDVADDESPAEEAYPSDETESVDAYDHSDAVDPSDSADAASDPNDSGGDFEPSPDGSDGETVSEPDASACPEEVRNANLRTRDDIDALRATGCVEFDRVIVSGGVFRDLSALNFIVRINDLLLLQLGEETELVTTAGMTNLEYVGEIFSTNAPDTLREFDFGTVEVGRSLLLERGVFVTSILPLKNLRMLGDATATVQASDTPICQFEQVEAHWRANGWVGERLLRTGCYPSECPCDLDEP